MNQMNQQAASAVQSTLHSEALKTMKQFGFDPRSGKHPDEVLNVKYHQAMTMELLKAAYANFPGNYNVQAVIADLLVMLQDKGRPQILATDARNGDKWLKHEFRRQFVLAVVYRAARVREAEGRVLEMAGITLSDNTWRKWKQRFTSLADRQTAKRAGGDGKAWHRDSDDAHLAAMFREAYGQKLPRAARRGTKQPQSSTPTN